MSVQAQIEALQQEGATLEEQARFVLGNKEIEAALKEEGEDAECQFFHGLASFRSIYADNPEILELLSKTHINEVIETLEAILKDKDHNRHVRRTAVRALGTLGPKAEKASATLIEMLGDEDKKIREFAAMSLGHLESEEAVSHLVAILENKNDPMDIRWEVVSALGLIGQKATAAIAVLKDMMVNEPKPFVKHAVEKSLEKIQASL